MPRPPRHLDSLLAVSAAQFGLVTAAQLALIGIPRSTVAYRSRQGAMWSRVLPGVHLVSGGLPDRTQREMASVLFAGEPCLLTGPTALYHWGIRSGRLQETGDDPRQPATVFVLTPHERRRTSTAFVRLVRTREWPEDTAALTAAGLPLAPPPRAVADAARMMRDPADVRALITESLRLRLVDVDQLRNELHRGARRGSAHLRSAIDAGSAGVWSAAEADMRDLVRVLPIPEPEWNATLVGPTGEVIAIADGWFDDVGLALEVDGRDYHADGRDWERTLARQRRYAQAGVPCLPFAAVQIRDEPDAVGTAIVAAYRQAAARPRPAVRVARTPLTPREAVAHQRWGG